MPKPLWHSKLSFIAGSAQEGLSSSQG